MDYLDFEVEVSPADGGEYEVQVRSEFGEATGRMRLPFDSLALQNRLQALQIALLRSGAATRRVASPEEETVERFGRELFEALFRDGPVRGRFEAARDGAWRRDAGLRVKLRIGAPDLAALPWEYLYDPSQGDFLALSLATPVVRFVPIARPIRPLAVRPPIRLLGMIAASDDLPGLDTERERQRLETALRPLLDREIIELAWLGGGTWRELQEQLLDGPWHIFHFIGHGGFDQVRGEGFVFLPDDAGRATRLPATGLGRLLGNHDPLRLAVLNSCEGARADDVDVFSSTAASIVRRGTPAVVAMQYEITDRAAVEFSRSFYAAVASGRPVDAALAVARTAISLELPGSLEWGTPALYMRSPDGVLFEVPKAVSPEIPPLPEPQVPDAARLAAEPAGPTEAVVLAASAPPVPSAQPLDAAPPVESAPGVESAPPPHAGFGATRDVTPAAPAAPPVAPVSTDAAAPTAARSGGLDPWRQGYGQAVIGGLVGGLAGLWTAAQLDLVYGVFKPLLEISDGRSWELHLWHLILAGCVGAGLGTYLALRMARQPHPGMTAAFVAATVVLAALLFGLRDIVSENSGPDTIVGAFPILAVVIAVGAMVGRAIGTYVGTRRAA